MKASSRNIKDIDMIALFDAASTYDVEQMREAVKELIENARVPNQSILRRIPVMSKKQLMKVLSDFYLKGSGLGVI